MVVVER